MGEYSLGQLNPEEAAAVRRFEEERASPKRRTTVPDLIGRWFRIVDDVAAGYDDVIDEYTNDLTVRGILEDFIQQAPSDLAERMRALLEPIDARFRAATRPDEQETVLRFYRADDGWWWRRVPVEGELADYLADLD
jgi:hypothetical protein